MDLAPSRAVGREDAYKYMDAWTMEEKELGKGSCLFSIFLLMLYKVKRQPGHVSLSN